MSERNGGGFLWFLTGIGIGAVVGISIRAAVGQ